ncbi:MAG: sulfur carrier protein ThiS [Anaerovoracaceae bacterium]|jgi:sulfur carrier protein
MVKINGENVPEEGKTVAEYLAEKGYDGSPVAVELNLAILPKTEYDQTVLKEGDVLEIVRFVGGG